MVDPTIEDPREVEKEMDKCQVITLGDIYRALKAHPEWALELRRVLLSADLLELPARLEEFAKHVDKKFEQVDKRFDQVDQRFEQVDKRFDQVDQRFDQVDQRFDQVDQRFEQVDKRFDQVDQRFEQVDQRFEQVDKRFERVEERLDRLEKDVEQLKKDVAQLKIDVAELKGDNFERRIRERAHAYFGRFFLRVKVIPGEVWLEVLDEAVSKGIITWEERDYALDLDVLIRCRKKDEPRELLLVVEASVSAYETDAERAMKRAEIFSKVFQMETIPVVIAKEIPKDLEEKFPLVVFITTASK